MSNKLSNRDEVLEKFGRKFDHSCDQTADISTWVRDFYDKLNIK
jgi:hypothetical protein